MKCAGCDEESSDPVFRYCRRCGAVLSSGEDNITSEITRKIQREDVFSFPSDPQQVVNVVNIRCIIHVSFGSEYLHDEVKLNKIRVKDDESRKEVEHCSRLPTYSVFASVPTSEIRFALEKTCQKLFGDNTFVRADLPEKNVRFIRELPRTRIPIDSGSIRFTIGFDYFGTDIQRDKDSIIRDLRAVLRDLYDWGNFNASLHFEFLIPFLKLEL
jgi:hypothetical protein